MKKLLSLLLALIMCLGMCTSCNDEEANTSESSLESSSSFEKNESESSEEELPSLYYSDDLNAFISDWKQAQQGTSGSKNVLNVQNGNNAESYISVPILKSDDFKFRVIEVANSQYIYYFTAIDAPQDKYFDYNYGIAVYVYKSNKTFNAVMEQRNLTSTDGYAYESKWNRWNINDNGKLITIHFPPSVVLTEAAMISEYFEFEKIYSSSNDSTEIK